MGTILPFAWPLGSLGLPGLRFFQPAFPTYNYCITKILPLSILSYLRALRRVGHAGGRLVIPSAVSGLPERLEDKKIDGLLVASGMSLTDLEPDYL